MKFNFTSVIPYTISLQDDLVKVCYHPLDVNTAINILYVFSHQRTGLINFGHQQNLRKSCEGLVVEKAQKKD